MKIASTRGDRSDNIRRESRRADAAGFFANAFRSGHATASHAMPADAVAHSIWKHRRKALRRSDWAKQERRALRRRRAVRERNASRWIAIVYVMLALATPLLLYQAPQVLSPAAPAIAEKALDGQLAVYPHPLGL